MDIKKEKIIPIVSIAAIVFLVAVFWYLFRNEKLEEKSLIDIPRSVQIGGESINLSWTDDNEGEDLIIQSDKKNYFGIDRSEVYFSLTNTNKKDQKIDLRFLFSNQDAKLEKIEKIADEKFTGLTPADNSSLKFESKENFVSSNYFSDEIRFGETNYYKAQLTYPVNSEGEFYIEAKGDNGAYGLLDPWYNSTGLVGYWSFDGEDMDWSATTAEAIDRSGQGNDGDVVGDTEAVIGKVGQALSFDGSGDYVNAGDVNGVDGVSKLTLSVWFYRDSSSDKMQIEKGPNISNKLGINLDTTNLYLNVGNNGNYYGRLTNSATGWQHIVMVFDGSGATDTDKLKCYIGGVEQTITYFTTLPAVLDDNSSDFIIGHSPVYGDYTRGIIDEVAVFNRDLSADEVAALHKLGNRKMEIKTTGVNKVKINTSNVNRLTSGLVGHWTFDGADMDWSATTAEAIDRSGQGNHGNAINMDLANATIGKNGQALNFNGSNEYINVANNPSVDMEERPFTINVWFYAESKGSTINGYAGTLVQKGCYGTTWSGYILGFKDSDPIYLYTRFKSNPVFIGSKAISLNEWHMATLVMRSSVEYQVLLDGEVDISGSATLPSLTSTRPLTIGSREGSAWNFDGKIDEVRIYNRALSIDEIAELYQMGNKKVNIE